MCKNGFYQDRHVVLVPDKQCIQIHVNIFISPQKQARLMSTTTYVFMEKKENINTFWLTKCALPGATHVA